MGTGTAVTPLAVRPHRLPVPHEPVWVTAESGDVTGAVVLLHAIGENRTGNNYLLRQVSDGCAASGLAAVRFDLPGCGESRSRLDVDAIDARVSEVTDAVVQRYPEVPVHWIARGLSAALLPDESDPRTGLRIALSPPDAGRLQSALADAPTVLAPRQPLTPDEVWTWTQIGAEPNLVGGLEVTTGLLRMLCDRLDPPRWDVAIVSAAAAHQSGLRLSTADPLFRAESDRAALSVLVARLVRSWPRWCRAHS